MAHKIWFITGASRGFGRIWTEAALRRGDQVAATIRNPGSLQDLAADFGDRLLPLTLDVTDRAAVFAAVAKARDHFGRLDVVVNNAGYGHFGMIEETTEAEARAQFETNVFGALWVLQAVAPILRTQKSGHILSVSSIGGIVAFPLLSVYNASKFALEALNDGLSGELAEFGVKVTLIEPTGYKTDWSGSSAKHAAPMPEYGNVRSKVFGFFSTLEPGDPQATAAAILKIVDAENPPLRLFLGKSPLQVTKHIYAQRIATWEEWNDVSCAAQGGQPD